MWILIAAIIVIGIGALLFFCNKSHPNIDVRDKHVLITGGSRGIAEYMAYLFSHLGAYLILASNQLQDVIL